ncbi:MAG: FAD-dependent monooxygenase [Pseudolabrys sp.]|nr:FAD-dependent monooxygenase [Pseudolabrys sp.]
MTPSLARTLPAQTDVLVVGAGPTGLALSIALRQAGVDHVVVDKLASGQNTSRAAVIHAHTLDVLASVGVAGDLVARGLKLDTFSIRDRDQRLLDLSFGGLDTDHSYLLMLPQDVTEKVLADRLASLGGTVHRGVSVQALTQGDSGVEATLDTASGPAVIRARYAVGADGMHSVVRAAAGIAFDGGAYGESFVLADVHMDWPLAKPEVSLFFSAAGLVVVAPLPDGSYRIVATVADAPEKPDVADIQALLDASGPRRKAGKVLDVVWSSRFRVHHRLASAYRKDRLFLIGDAAHVHSPAGGQGMNCGLVDACVLGPLLADVIGGRRPEAALDLHQTLRRPAAAQVLGLAGRLTRLATMHNPAGRALRNAAFHILDRVAPAKRKIVMNLSGLARPQLAQLPPPRPALRRPAAPALLAS